MPFVRNYGDRPILHGGAWNEQIGIFDTLLNERSNVQYYIIWFRAYGERPLLMGGHYESDVIGSGIFDRYIEDSMDNHYTGVGFRALELW